MADTDKPDSPSEPSIKLREGWEWRRADYHDAPWYAKSFHDRDACGIDINGNLWITGSAPPDVVASVLAVNSPSSLAAAVAGMAVPLDESKPAPGYEVQPRAIGCVLIHPNGFTAWCGDEESASAESHRIYAVACRPAVLSAMASVASDSERQARRIAELESALRKIASMPWSSSDVEGVAHDMQDVATESLFAKESTDDDAK